MMRLVPPPEKGGPSFGQNKTEGEPISPTCRDCPNPIQLLDQSTSNSMPTAYRRHPTSVPSPLVYVQVR